MPALPAFALLTAAIPLLVPTFVDRMGSASPRHPAVSPDLRTTVAIVAFLAVVPSPSSSRPLRYRSRSSRTRRMPTSSRSWSWTRSACRPTRGSCRSPFVASAAPTYSPGRTRQGVPARSTACTAARRRRASRRWCANRVASAAATSARRRSSRRRDRHYVDREAPPDAVYRIGVAANWLDETEPRRRVRDQPTGRAVDQAPSAGTEAPADRVVVRAGR